MWERIIIPLIAALFVWGFYVVGSRQPNDPTRWIAWGIALVIAIIAVVYLFTGSVPALN